MFRWTGAILLAAAVLFHVWSLWPGWTSRSLPGNEFRQAQTALSAFFIQRDSDFSLAYPTPLFGPPWSVPFEFPLYQWTAVALSNALGIPLVEAGRWVSLLCFYAALPALALLLGRLRLDWNARLLVLALVVVSPVYLFYSRAWLIETMALMFALWFLLGYLNTVERGHAGWLAVANIAGAGAGLVKVTTLIVYLFPAALVTLAWVWRAWREPAGRPIRLVGRAAAATAVPFLVTYAWLRYADHIKAGNPFTSYLTSEALHHFNIGAWGVRFTSKEWVGQGQRILEEVASWPVLVIFGLALVLAGGIRWRGTLLGLAAFCAPLVLFPILYSVHGYYFTANAAALLVVLGLAVVGCGERWHSPLVPVLLAVLVAGLQARTYLGHHYREHNYWSPGGTGLTDALRGITEPDDVLLITGDDWSSIIPYYAERRAAMIPFGPAARPEATAELLDPLRDWNVPVLVVRNPAGDRLHVPASLIDRLDLTAEPVFAWRDIEVYVRRDLQSAALGHLEVLRPEGVEVLLAAEESEEPLNSGRDVPVARLSPIEQRAFGDMTPRPVRVFATFGVGAAGEPGNLFYNAHPESRLWFKVDPGERRIRASFRIEDGAWGEVAPPDMPTDGVVFRVVEHRPDADDRVLYERWLRPTDEPADRGLQHLDLRASVAPEAELRFETGPGPRADFTRDWAVWGQIEIR